MESREAGTARGGNSRTRAESGTGGGEGGERQECFDSGKEKKMKMINEVVERLVSRSGPRGF